MPPLLPPPLLPPPQLLPPPPGGRIPPDDPPGPGIGSSPVPLPPLDPLAAGLKASAICSGKPACSVGSVRPGRSRTGESTRSLGCQGCMCGLDWVRAPAARSPGERSEKIAAGSLKALRKAALPCSASTPAAPLGGRIASHAKIAQPILILFQSTRKLHLFSRRQLK